MISESFVLRWLLLAQTAAALLRAAPAHLFEASARLLLSTLAAQGPDGPPDEMLEPCRGHVQDMSGTDLAQRGNARADSGRIFFGLFLTQNVWRLPGRGVLQIAKIR